MSILRFVNGASMHHYSMDVGQIFAPAISALPPSVVVVFRKEPGRRCDLFPILYKKTIVRE